MLHNVTVIIYKQVDYLTVELHNNKWCGWNLSLGKLTLKTELCFGHQFQNRRFLKQQGNTLLYFLQGISDKYIDLVDYYATRNIIKLGIQ
jgi:hypothetical protein